MIRILIADDHQLFIDGIKSLLRSQKNIQVVAEAANGNQVLEQLPSAQPDVLLLDVNMPVLDGLETLKQVKAAYPQVRVLMLTMFSSRDYIEKLLKAGADGYVLKNTSKDELVLAIETLVRGQSYFSREVTERIMEGLQKKKAAAATEVELTGREKEVLSLIVKELTTQEIADSLFISAHTVETHRKNLISKLGVRNLAGLVKYALQHGLAD